MKPETPVHQPKMLQRIQLRYALGLLGVAVLLFGWVFLKGFFQNAGDVGSRDTSGWITALRQTSGGQQVVAILPDNSIIDSPDYRDGVIDRDPTFNASGDRIFFVSDRDQTTKSLQIFRWNPQSNKVNQRTSGKLAQEHPTVDESASGADANDMLVIKAGVVVDFNPIDAVAHQLVPVVGKSPVQTGGDDNGMGTQFGPEYQNLGSSFREAHWTKGHKYIVGIMHGDDGEALVCICTQPVQGGTPMEDGQPHGIVKGAHVDMSVDPSSGNVAYSVEDFHFVDPKEIPPSMIQNGKVVIKVKNLLGLFNPDDAEKSGPIMTMEDATKAFEQPQVSPDGSTVAFIIGNTGSEGFKPLGVVVCPFALAGGKSGKMLMQGMLAMPSWSPDSKQIAVSATSEDGHSDIAVLTLDGAAPRVPTQGKGSFTSPRFSPMRSKAGS